MQDPGSITSRLLLSISAAVLVAIGLGTLVAYQRTPPFAIFLIWYSAITAAVSICSARYIQYQRVFERAMIVARRKFERRKTGLAKFLRKKIRPRIDFCEGLDRVCRRSYELIVDAHSQRTDEYRYITFYGAAHLSTPDAEFEEYGSVGGSGEVSPYQQYVGAIEAATGDKVRMRRYMRLFRDKEFDKRSPGVQREYVHWLKGQHNMLSRNPNYILADVVRAPKWGSTIARIITHVAIMEITGNGEAAVVITDNHLGETIRRAARDSVIGRDAKNEPDYYGQAPGCKTPDQFKAYYLELEKRILTKPTTDEEARA